MVKFGLFLSKPEDIVFTTTAQTSINVAGKMINVGTHCVTFSGTSLTSQSENNLVTSSENVALS